jgi:hypothetical protein
MEHALEGFARIRKGLSLPVSSRQPRELGSSYPNYKVRIDPKAVVGGYPALTIRKLVRRLNNLLCWNAETVGVILRIERSNAEAIVRVLVEAGLTVAEPSLCTGG